MKNRVLRFESLEERQLLAVCAGAETLMAPAPTSAEWVVTTNRDTVNSSDGFLSLREAVRSAAQGDVITFDPTLSGRTIKLSQGQLVLSRGITVDASGLDAGITVSAGGASRVFSVTGGTADRPVTLVGLKITGGNADSGSGGGIYIAGTAVISDCVLASNSAGDDGGAVYLESGSAEIRNTLFTGNSVSDDGGAVFIQAGSDLAVIDSIFCENYSWGAGAALDIYGSASITNCLIYANRSDNYGGALYIGQGSSASMTNTTVTRNSAGRFGGALYYAEDFNCYNSIIVGNTAEESGDDIYVLRGTTGGFYTLSGYTNWEVSNTPYVYSASKPLFANAENDDFRLAETSQAINRGSSGYINVQTDLAGNPRIVGRAVDLGAYENQTGDRKLGAPSILTGTRGIYVSYGANRHNITWGAVENAEEYELAYSADGGDWTSVKTTETSLVVMAYTYGSAMTYRVRAVGRGIYGDSDWSAEKTFAVCPMDINNDGDISGGDRALLAMAWLAEEGDDEYRYYCDINADGDVSNGDRTFLVANWLGTAGDSDLVCPRAFLADRFRMTSDMNIMDSNHLGVINHHVTCGVPYEYVGTLDSFWAPPYVSSNCRCDLLVNGNPVTADRWTWYPYQFQSSGEADGITVASDFLLASDQRAGLMKFTFTNGTGETKTISVTLKFSQPTLDVSDAWEFAAARSSTPCVRKNQSDRVLFTQTKGSTPLAVVFAGEDWIDDADGEESFGAVSLVLQPGESVSLSYAAAIGELSVAEEEAVSLAEDADNACRTALADYENDLADIYTRLPRLESDSAALVHLYDRSLMHFFTNRWDVDEFVLDPYYGTGSMLGGCVCSYLWNFGEPWEILHLYDPAAAREHIKQFLSIDLTQHFAFLPTTGSGFGPWYMVNQEKILGQIYYYTRITGDFAFLDEEVNGLSIWEHVRLQATVKDDQTKPVSLIDYGSSNSHLELRRASNLYNHVMPDLNGRRYANYIMAAALLDQTGRSDEGFADRAETLKTLLKQQLWDEDLCWFNFINDQGKPEARWTIQMYKLVGSPVLDDEELTGLISHWNEDEFLGPYGVHSLSKTDPWYDPADIDNGGPGACTDFGPQVAERFYKAGYPELGADIIRRMLWLGERMPYWGDSVVAGEMDYRRDTPLQCMFDSVTIAQTVIFGMFGISSRFDGVVEVTPALPDFAQRVALRGVKIRGLTFDVAMDTDGYTVTMDGREYRAAYGQTVQLGDSGGKVLNQRTEQENGYHLF